MDDQDLVQRVLDGRLSDLSEDEINRGYDLVLAMEGLGDIPDRTYETKETDADCRSTLEERGHHFYSDFSSMDEVLEIITDTVTSGEDHDIVIHPSCITEKDCLRLRVGSRGSGVSTHYPIGDRIPGEVGDLFSALRELNIPYRESPEYWD